MVDIPEQAVKAAIRGYASSKQHTFDGQIHDALTAAAPYMSGVDVKQLRWRERDNGAYAHCAVGYYEIKETRLGFCVYHNKFLVSKDMFETLEDAKVAAQDNLERRLLVCLSVKPVDVAAAREQALEEAEHAVGSTVLKHRPSDYSGLSNFEAYEAGQLNGLERAQASLRALKSQPTPQTGGDRHGE